MNVEAILTRYRRTAAKAPPLPLPRGTWSRLLRHREAQIGLLLGLLLLGAVLLGPLVITADPHQPNYTTKLHPPSLDHLLGTDQSGRDVLARVLEGGRRSLGAALLVLAGTFATGLLLGITAGMAGGVIDGAIMRLVDILLALPGIVLALAVVAVLGVGFQNLMLALIISGWAYYARLARSYVLTARQRPDVIAARLAGIGWLPIILGHIVPGVATQLLVVVTLDLGSMIAAISGLSFLGLGVQPPLAEWGAMLSDSRFYFTIAPWLLFGPGIPIFLAVVSTNLIGNALRDVLDPGRQT